MHGKQLAISFVSPFKSIMQSSQVSCSTNLHHLMARERNGVGKAPDSSPWGLSWPSHVAVTKLSRYFYLNPSFSTSPSPVFFFFQGNIPQHGSLYHHFLCLRFAKRFLTKCQICLSGIFLKDWWIKLSKLPLLSHYIRGLVGGNPSMVNLVALPYISCDIISPNMCIS